MALIKQEHMKEEEIQLSTSGGGECKGEVEGPGSDPASNFDSDKEFDVSFIEEYCEQAEIPRPMTISKELFYTDAMVAKRYAQLSPLDKERFDQMKVLAEQIKMETGDYSLIEDLIAKVVSQRFGQMQKQDVRSMLALIWEIQNVYMKCIRELEVPEILEWH